jgi:HAD superfamily hydrolase (TIGR01549 family)/HAD superfamily hydrolase (TIGR01509 family)
MTIQTIILDMGGTIDTFWFSPEMRLQATPGLQKLLSSAGINLHLTDEQLYELVTIGLEHYHQWRLVTFEEISPKLVWRQYILPNYPEFLNQIDLIAEDLMIWIETRYYQRTMRPEIPSVLDSIQKMGYKIGLISNVNSRGQVPLNLTEYGIIDYFNPIVLSSEYGHRKPDPSIFHYAARLSNSPTSECIYIGDRINRDILGAKRAGYKLAIQIKHEFDHGETDIGASPDFVLNNMTELLDILRSDDRLIKRINKDKVSDNKIHAVLFDADGVLYYRNNKDEEIDAFIRRYGLKSVDNIDPELVQLRHKAFIGQITFEQYRTVVLNKYGITDPELVSQGIRKILDEKNEIHFFKNSVETLKTLKNRNIYLGIVTDTAQPLRVKINKLERGGIGHLWDSIIPSSEVGVQKPDPRIYQLALKQLGLTSAQAIFVGHKSSELEGARNVGMHTVAFNYDHDAKADIYIENFSDLTGLTCLN